MADTVKLTAISSRSWEHPADRAALNALRALPGFDEVLRRIMGFLGERGVRQLFLANAVRVGPEQTRRMRPSAPTGSRRCSSRLPQYTKSNSPTSSGSSS